MTFFDKQIIKNSRLKFYPLFFIKKHHFWISLLHAFTYMKKGAFNLKYEGKHSNGIIMYIWAFHFHKQKVSLCVCFIHFCVEYGKNEKRWKNIHERCITILWCYPFRWQGCSLYIISLLMWHFIRYFPPKGFLKIGFKKVQSYFDIQHSRVIPWGMVTGPFR